MKGQSVLSEAPDILCGEIVFAGTRVPATTLIDYLIKGHSVDDFLDDFPSVTRGQAILALSELKDRLLSSNHEVTA